DSAGFSMISRGIGAGCLTDSDDYTAPQHFRNQVTSMAAAPLDLVGIGNAIVDVIAHADERFLASEGLAKGAMTLIDEARGEALYSRMGPAMESSGGSAANTIAGFASFGGTAGFIGKVRADQLGQVFRHDIVSLGVHYD